MGSAAILKSEPVREIVSNSSIVSGCESTIAPLDALHLTKQRDQHAQAGAAAVFDVLEVDHQLAHAPVDHGLKLFPQSVDLEQAGQVRVLEPDDRDAVEVAHLVVFGFVIHGDSLAIGRFEHGDQREMSHSLE